MQVIFARMSLDEIVKYITVELQLNAKNEAHVQDRHGHGQRGHRENRLCRAAHGFIHGAPEGLHTLHQLCRGRLCRELRTRGEGL